MDEYVVKLKNFFNEYKNEENAKDMKAYMRDKFEFLGIKSKKRRKLAREFYKKDGKFDLENIEKLSKEVWELDEREFQYILLDFLKSKKKKLSVEHIDLIEYLILNKSWWDTVDLIAKHLVGEIFKDNQDVRNKYLEKWINSDNIWLQRTVILFQLGYKEETNETILYKYIKKINDTDEFFINKAIGWALREYSKVNPDSVKQFIESTELDSLSIREGSKYIN